MASVQPENRRNNMSRYNEFMPWNVWVKQPANKDLELNEAKRKYAVDRDAHMQKLIYYENQAIINKDMPNG